MLEIVPYMCTIEIPSSWNGTPTFLARDPNGHVVALPVPHGAGPGTVFEVNGYVQKSRVDPNGPFQSLLQPQRSPYVLGISGVF